MSNKQAQDMKPKDKKIGRRINKLSKLLRIIESLFVLDSCYTQNHVG